MELNDIRDGIDKIDNQIFDLIVERVDLAREVLKAKSALGKPIYDAEREKVVIGRQVEKAKKLGLPTEFVADIYKALIRGCTEVEENIQD